MNVFFSVGSPSTERQKQFSDSVREFLRHEELTPLTPGQNYALNLQPLKAVEQCMRSCSGVVVLAFERIHITRGFERRGGDEPRKVDGQNLPTVWNQVEGAMGYARGLPLLVLAENGLRADALLENKYDWNVQWMELDPAALSTPAFHGVFHDWKSRLVPPPPVAREPADARMPDNAADMSIHQLFTLFTRLRAGQAWAVVSIVLGMAVSLAAAGFKAGQAVGHRAPATVAVDSTTVLPSLWIDSVPRLVLNDRVSITASAISDSASQATLDLRMPGGIRTFTAMKQGEQRAFVYEGRQYLLHLLNVTGGDAGPGAVQIKVVRGN